MIAPRRHRTPRRARGFTLLEVILALGILAAALAVLGEFSRLAYMNAQASTLETRAAMVAESVLAELEAGTAQLVNFSGEWVDLESGQAAAEWRYEVLVEQTATEGLLQARVTVEEIEPASGDTPMRFQLIRWFQDPEYLSTVESNSETSTATTQ